MTISLLIAVAQNNVIGKDNTLIWQLSDDLKNFKKLTTGHCILMGRKTFDSIGRPLPNRINIVISRNKNLNIEGCHVVHSLEQAIKLASKLEQKEEIFIIGGAEIYNQALPLCNKVYLTKVYAKPEGDAFFDLQLFENWQTIASEKILQGENNQYDFEISILEKNE